MTEAVTRSWLLNDVQEKSKKINPTPLIKREFVKVVEQNNHSDKKTCNGAQEDDCLRLMQWNLLAQGLCQSSDGFLLCPPSALDWHFRQYRILEELLSYSADIFCLEEVDHFSFIAEHLRRIGIEGCFYPKPDSPCLYQANNFGPDGCAIFWRVSKLILLDQENIILQDDKRRKTKQVALICRFRGLQGHLKDKEFICVATHLKSKFGYDEIRFQQGKFLEQLLREKAAGVPIILCGDFNADPQSKAVYVFNTSKLMLKSAYTFLSSEGHEPPYTTWKVRAGRWGRQNTEICHTIDYMFFSAKHFRVTQLLKIPTPEEIGPGYLPSYSYPSDHVSLVADFKLADVTPV